MSYSEGVTGGCVFTDHKAEATHVNLVTIFEVWGSGSYITLVLSMTLVLSKITLP